MLGTISFGSALGALFMLVDSANDPREVHTLSPGIEATVGLVLLAIAIVCAVLARLLDDD